MMKERKNEETEEMKAKDVLHSDFRTTIMDIDFIKERIPI